MNDTRLHASADVAHDPRLALLCKWLEQGLGFKQYGIAPYHNGSMASWIPSGAGFALAFKYRREPRVYAAMTGEGCLRAVEDFRAGKLA